MPTELETQVAEAKCFNCDGEGNWRTDASDDSFDLTWETCPTCQGTGLRWPPLSRECPPSGSQFRSHVGRDLPCCHGSGQVPDVTLERIISIHIAEGRKDPRDWFSFSQYQIFTPLEASCRKLLEARDDR